MRVLLLSAYAARSHVYWQQGLQTMFASWHWTVLSLPPRHFSWRVRGNPLYWAISERDSLEQGYDLLVATSMVDLATLRGLVPDLASVPAVVYFHENQFAYPLHRQQKSLLEAQMVSLYSALAADQILFNSSYNLDSFLAGCTSLLGKLPDRVPPGVVAKLQEKAAVLPVPLAADLPVAGPAAWPGAGQSTDRPLRLLWVGRFEYDKGGDGLLQILQRLESGELNYELAVIGQQFRNSPDVFGQIERDFAHRLVQFGYVESTRAYHGILRGADMVLSTALHEFQGLAVLEAVALGCVPVVPDRLAYPEIYPAQYRYASSPEDLCQEAAAAVDLIRIQSRGVEQGSVPAPDVATYTSEQLQPRYLQTLLATADTQHSQ